MKRTVRTLKSIDRVGKAYSLVINTTHHAFPVVEYVDERYEMGDTRWEMEH